MRSRRPSIFLQVSYADNSRHYGFYIDGDIAKLPGGGRRGAAVLCELVPGQLAEDPDQAGAQPGARGPAGARGAYPPRGGYPQRGGYPREEDGGYPSYPGF